MCIGHCHLKLFASPKSFASSLCRFVSQVVLGVRWALWCWAADGVLVRLCRFRAAWCTLGFKPSVLLLHPFFHLTVFLFHPSHPFLYLLPCFQACRLPSFPACLSAGHFQGLPSCCLAGKGTLAVGKYTTKSVYKKKKTLNLFNFLRKRGKKRTEGGEKRGTGKEWEKERRGEERKGKERT